MLTAENLQQFVPMLMSKMYIECLIYGNTTQSEALKIANLVKGKIFKHEESTPLLPKQMLLYRELELPDGT